jgi:energy-coupling factor transporter ATP-binding protein EcfA2
MQPSVPTDNPPTLYKSLSAIRAAHTRLLREYEKYDEPEEGEKLPEEFIQSVETFLWNASSSGALMDVEEDRTDAQALLNYWTTVLYNFGKAPRPATLHRFMEEIAARQIGERCPYPGLKAFNREDRVVFYGRRELVRQMTTWLAKENFVAVVGLSGSGKSSIVKAGLISELQEGAVPGSDQWTYYEPIVPGSEALRSLSDLTCPPGIASDEWHKQQAQKFLDKDEHLLHLLSKDNKTAVVVVDQFEELFTLSKNEPARRAFIFNLVRLATDPARRHIVIVTMRSEFDSYVARYPELYELFERLQVRVPPLTPIALRKAIEKPAERAGLTFEPGLVEDLVQQVLGEPAGLPLLQFTLYKLWEKRSGKTITWASYRELGGSPREVLAKVANEIYQSFKLNEDRNISREIMLKIVRPGAGLDITSNRVSSEELYKVGPRDNVDRVLERWVTAGLLRVTASGEAKHFEIEVMHEALIRNWPQLGAWVDEQRETDRRRLRLTAAAQQWVEHDRDPGGLLGGSLLVEALEYRDLDKVESEFVAASQRKIKLRTWLLRFAAVFVVVAFVLFLYAGYTTYAALKLQAENNKAQEKLQLAQKELKTAEEDVRTTQMKLGTAQEDVVIAQQNLALTRKASDAAAVEAARRLEVLHRQTAEEMAKLEDYKKQAADARKVASTAEAKAQEAELRSALATSELEKAKTVEKDLQQSLVLASSLADSRPALLINDGHFGEAAAEWSSRLESQRPQIENTLRSVGRLEADSTSPLHIGTAFMVTPRVALAFYGPSYSETKFLIDFRDKPDDGVANKFRATVIAVLKDKNVALLSVEPETESGLKLPGPVTLAKRPSTTPGNPLYIVGYPGRDNRTPDNFLKAIFKDIYGVKRLQPGYLLSTDRGETKLFHDCFTVGGNGGSPVVDLETGKVIGLHVGGKPPTATAPAEKYALPLWKLANHPEFVKAGITFQ